MCCGKAAPGSASLGGPTSAITPRRLVWTLTAQCRPFGRMGEAISACLSHALRGVTAMHNDHDRAREKRAALALWSHQIED